ncbi:MAG TPA: hypothetical protein PKV42_08965 [Thiobacillus sp.]|nr:MAG: hypothetical protein B7Y27_09105 [Hydrogenophilales bacterium 16-64-40]OZA33506.1 MAG: hypothetical protein B7X82_08995 [Hydrogenophilales bacterium 17-64-65]HQS82579.1 hypothetical protein [Thiobacillus sp.]HQT32589.1 hypothetical protein [Thiobacillus sp.]
MSKKTLITAAVGTAFVASMAAAPIVSAAENPFALSGLSSGYQVADNHGEMKPTDKKMPEGKCGEGKCGATKKDAKATEMKPTDKKMPEGKCGEGKCGAAKKPVEDKSGAMQ